MSHVEDLRTFNEKWLEVHLSGGSTGSVVSHLPLFENVREDIHDLVIKMVSCFVQPIVSIEKFAQLALDDGARDEVKYPVPRTPYPVPLDRVCLKSGYSWRDLSPKMYLADTIHPSVTCISAGRMPNFSRD